MPRIGQIFRENREKKGVTPSQAAQATRMKVQTVQYLENNDFGKIAAPAYVKGFIRLYAEYLGLDPAPLIREYLNELGQPPSPITPPAKPGSRGRNLKKMAGRISAGLKKVPPAVWLKLVLIVIFLLLVWMFGLKIAAAVSRRGDAAVLPASTGSRHEAGSGLLEDVPEPYWDVLDPAVRAVQDGAVQ